MALDRTSRLIVVDDDASILELLKMVLEDEGFQVKAFNSPTAAVREAATDPPDGIIVDLMMPGMTGLEIIETLKRNGRTNRIPVLVCSAYYGDLRRTLQRAGKDGISYLRKPFQLDDLVGTVRRMVSGERKALASSGNHRGNAGSQRSFAMGSRPLN